MSCVVTGYISFIELGSHVRGMREPPEYFNCIPGSIRRFRWCLHRDLARIDASRTLTSAREKESGERESREREARERQQVTSPSLNIPRNYTADHRRIS